MEYNDEKEFNTWIGRRIKEEREKRGLKKVDIARKTGLPDSFLSNIENKGKKVSSFSLLRILKAIGCSPGELFEGDEAKKKRSTSNSIFRRTGSMSFS